MTNEPKAAMTSQIEKGLVPAGIAELVERAVVAALTATGESKTESSPEVTEASPTELQIWDAIQSRYWEWKNATGAGINEDAMLRDLAQSAFFARRAALSVGREGAAQGRDDDAGVLLSLQQAILQSRTLADFMTVQKTVKMIAALDTSPEGMVEERLLDAG